MTTLKEGIIGVWELLAFEDQDEEGNKIYPFGKDAKGFIVYHPDGYVSAQLMKQGRTPYESGDLLNGTLEEMAEAANGFLAYVGRFDVIEEEGKLIHYMDVCLNPTLLGKQLPRLATIEGDILTIHNEFKPHQTFIWRRVKAHQY